MANLFQNWFGGVLPSERKPIDPVEEMGTSGTAIHYGYVVSNERNRKARGTLRYETAMDILLNAAIVGAGMRFYVNLVAKPKWKFTPAIDLPNGKSSKLAELAAELMAKNVEDMTDSWPRTVRRMAAHRFYGFGIHEWTMEKINSGYKLLSLEPRPWHTIEQWDTDPKGNVIGVNQRSPQDGQFNYIARGKVAYLVDDAFTDSPEGIGIWRHLIEPFERYKAYGRVEGMGFERDLRGIPVGSAPYKALAQAVTKKVITQAQMDALVKPIEDFVKLSAKSEETGFVYDSSVYENKLEAGTTNSGNPMFDLKLLTSSGQGFADIGNAIERVQYQMAMLIGAENLLVGSGSSGSRALSEDKSRNLYLNVDGCLTDIVAAAKKDIVPPVMIYNGIPRQYWPIPKAESAAYLDAEKKSQILVNLANAGSPIAPGDEAVNEVRIEAGLSAIAADMIGMDAMNAMNDTNNQDTGAQR